MVGCDDDAAIKYAEHPRSRLRRSLLGESRRLRHHAEIARFLRCDRNAPAERSGVEQMTRLPLNPLPFLMIC